MQKGDKTRLEFEVRKEIHEGFLTLFGDHNPLHTNHEYAASKGFDSKVMHGNILGGFLSYFVGECLPVKNVIIHEQQISYAWPVYLNDRLNFEAELVDVHDSVGAYEYRFFFSNALGKKVAKGRLQIGLI